MNPPASIEAAAASLAPRGYGARLRSAREQTGLTVEQVAQQLKLAPRQVHAIEEEDLAVLPEVTYIRGFVRNYARLLRIDAGELLDGLPANGAEPAQGATFRRSGTRMAELPPDSASRASWVRWAIPLLLAIGALAFAGYEWLRQERARAAEAAPGSELPAASGAQPAAAGTGAAQPQTLSVQPAVVPEGQAGPPGAAAGAPAGAATGAPQSANPGALPPPAFGAPAAGPSGAAVGGASPASPAPRPAGAGGPGADASPAVAGAAPVAFTPASSGSATPASAEAAHPAAAGEVRLAFSETAWVEVRDGRGRVLHSETNPAGSTRVITGDPPLALVIGNAGKVRLTFNGQPVDLAQHTRSNIARLSLR